MRLVPPWGRWLAVRIVAHCMRLDVGDAELRAGFDRSYRHRDEEWRRQVWREAAERAARSA